MWVGRRIATFHSLGITEGCLTTIRSAAPTRHVSRCRQVRMLLLFVYSIPAPPKPSGKGCVPVRKTTMWLMLSGSGMLMRNLVWSTVWKSVCTCTRNNGAVSNATTPRRLTYQASRYDRPEDAHVAADWHAKLSLWYGRVRASETTLCPRTHRFIYGGDDDDGVNNL